MSAPSARSPAPGLRWVFIGIGVISLVTGVAAYRRYAGSERWVAEGIARMEARGPALTVEGCIDEVVAWHHDCDVQGANAAVCQQAVGITMFHCLRAADRAVECEPYAAPESSAAWVWAKCEERGMRCVNKRECACAEAYRAADSFCRTGGEAVQL